MNTKTVDLDELGKMLNRAFNSKKMTAWDNLSKAERTKKIADRLKNKSPKDVTEKQYDIAAKAAKKAYNKKHGGSYDLAEVKEVLQSLQNKRNKQFRKNQEIRKYYENAGDVFIPRKNAMECTVGKKEVGKDEDIIYNMATRGLPQDKAILDGLKLEQLQDGKFCMTNDKKKQELWKAAKKELKKFTTSEQDIIIKKFKEERDAYVKLAAKQAAYEFDMRKKPDIKQMEQEIANRLGVPAPAKLEQFFIPVASMKMKTDEASSKMPDTGGSSMSDLLSAFLGYE